MGPNCAGAETCRGFFLHLLSDEKGPPHEKTNHLLPGCAAAAARLRQAGRKVRHRTSAETDDSDDARHAVQPHYAHDAHHPDESHSYGPTLGDRRRRLRGVLGIDDAGSRAAHARELCVRPDQERLRDPGRQAARPADADRRAEADEAGAEGPALHRRLGGRKLQRDGGERNPPEELRQELRWARTGS